VQLEWQESEQKYFMSPLLLLLLAESGSLSL
jgi:hypothetical protein